MTVNTVFAFWIGVRLSLNLPNVRQEREKSQCRSPGSPRCKSATGEADPGKAAKDCPESDSCPLGEGKKEEAVKLIDCVKLDDRAGKRRHEDPLLAIFRLVGQEQKEKC